TNKDIGNIINSDERTTKRIMKLNDLIPELQNLVSEGKLSQTAGEQLAHLTVDNQRALLEVLGKEIEKTTVKKAKQYREEETKSKENNIDYKKQLELMKKQLEQAKQSEEIALRRLEEEQEKEPEVVERVIEDETKINKLEKQIQEIEQEKKELENKLSLNEKDAREYRQLQDDINNLRSKKDDIVRQIDNASSIGKFIARIDRSFEEDLAPIKYSRAIEELGRSEVVQESLENIVSKVENWCREIRGIMKDKNIVEVIDYEE